LSTAVPEIYWTLSSEELIRTLGSSASGLDDAEASRRLLLKGSGHQERSQVVKDVLLFLSQFKSPLVLLLVAAVILSAFLGEKTDVIIILSILLFTGILGFVQERNAGKAVEALLAIVTTKAKVLRNNSANDVATGNVVPGDIILFAAGDIIPADCVILE